MRAIHCDDDEAMARRDKADAEGASICPECDGSGLVWQTLADQVTSSPKTCPRCKGETWIDRDGKPYRIDP